MITPDIKEIKDEVDMQIQRQLEHFCRVEVKKLKLTYQKAEYRADEANKALHKAHDELRTINGEDLRKKFFEFNNMTQSSPYEDALKVYHATTSKN